MTTGTLRTYRLMECSSSPGPGHVYRQFEQTPEGLRCIPGEANCDSSARGAQQAFHGGAFRGHGPPTGQGTTRIDTIAQARPVRRARR